MGDFDLRAEARRFAGEIQDVLNGTVCNGITIRPVQAASPDVFKVGYEITRDDYSIKPVPLCIDGRQPSGYLGVSFSLSADDEGRYLMVRSSVFAYSHDQELGHPLIHYDYERDKADDYPQAHLQVCAEPDAWAAICGRRGLGKPFEKLHLPLGGRRFRPILEDLIWFLIAEKLADHRGNWRDALDAGYARYEAGQVGAVIRRHRSLAQEILNELNRVGAESLRQQYRQ